MTLAPPSALNIRLSTTLERVAVALQVLGKMIVEVETSIHENVKETGQSAPAPMSVQKLDHALQMVDELGLLMQRLSECQPTDARCHVDQLITPIRLEGLRNLIAHGENETEQTLQTEKAGHVSLF